MQMHRGGGFVITQIFWARPASITYPHTLQMTLLNQKARKRTTKYSSRHPQLDRYATNTLLQEGTSWQLTMIHPSCLMLLMRIGHTKPFAAWWNRQHPNPSLNQWSDTSRKIKRSNVYEEEFCTENKGHFLHQIRVSRSTQVSILLGHVIILTTDMLSPRLAGAVRIENYTRSLLPPWTLSMTRTWTQISS